MNILTGRKGFSRHALWQGFLGELGDGVILTDPQARIAYCNEAAQEILEWPEMPKPGLPFHVCCPLLDVRTGLPYDNPVLQAMHTGRSVGLARNIGVLGTQGPIYLSMTCAPMRSRKGSIVGCIVIVRDVTHLRALEMKVEEDQRYMRSVFSAATVGFCLLNVKGSIVDINEAALEIMNASSDNVLGLQFGEAFICESCLSRGCGMSAPCKQCPARINIQAAIADDTYTSEFEFVMRSKRAQESLWLKVFVSQMGVGESKQVILAIINESARRRYEEKLKAAKDAAEEAGRTKMRFLSNMSHEIRTPINGVLGMLKLALRNPPPEKLQEYLKNAQQSSQDLLRLINDILDFSKLDSGRMKLERINFDLRLMLEQVEDTYKTLARAQGLTLSLPDINALPQFVRGDPLRIRQIFSNLLNNALKFTHAGSITIQAVVGSQGGKPTLEFSVRDTGIGMKPEELKRIFQPFAQADPSTTRRYGGSGLGLTIVRELLLSMGGNIEVKSWPGKGSLFSFWIPLIVAREAEPEPRDESAFVNPKLTKLQLPESERLWLQGADNAAAPVAGATEDISDLMAYAMKQLNKDKGK